jgi:hypothetical protein
MLCLLALATAIAAAVAPSPARVALRRSSEVCFLRFLEERFVFVRRTNPLPKAMSDSDEEDEPLPKLKNPFFFFWCVELELLTRFSFGGGAAKKPPRKPL